MSVRLGHSFKAVGSHTWLRENDSGALRDLVIQAAKGIASTKHDVVDMTVRILSLAAAFYLPYGAEDRTKFSALFRNETEKAMRIV